jgi:hypothetical protein
VQASLNVMTIEHYRAFYSVKHVKQHLLFRQKEPNKCVHVYFVLSPLVDATLQCGDIVKSVQ